MGLLETVIVVLLVFWILGFAGGVGMPIHLLLVVLIVLLIFRLINPRAL